MSQILYKLLQVCQIAQSKLTHTSPSCLIGPAKHRQFNFNYLYQESGNNTYPLRASLQIIFIIFFSSIYLPSTPQMISRLWNMIESLFGLRRERSFPIKRVQKKQRFLVIEDPYEPKPKAVGKQKSVEPLPMPKNAEQLMNIYRITSNFEQNSTGHQEARENDELFLNLRELSDAINLIEEKQKFISNSNEMISSITDMLSVMELPSKCEEVQGRLYRKYMRIVEDTVSVKYTGERIDYPEITFENFKQIYNYWNMDQKYGQGVISGYEHLRYCHLKLLGPDKWLNDELITEYINRMNLKLAERQGNNYLIFNSLKVTSLFDKTDYKKLEKILQRQKVTRSTILVLAIHKKNHWLFLKMEESAISIYDSLVSDNLKFPLISKIIKFAQYYYQSDVEVETVSTFPRQNNGNDCGMMMLCGMKDLVRDYRNWSFSQNDIPYKRALVTQELLENRITGF